MTPPAESPTPAASPETPTPTPAERVLRVTAETTPAPSRSPRQKDEKKAAAGRAGDAARKAKTERLERELVAAKEALVFVADPRPSRPGSGPPDAQSNEEAAPRRQSDKKEEAGPALFTWPVGVLVAAAGGLAYRLHPARAEPSPPLPPPLEEKKPPVLSPDAGPAQQLKVKPNPHYME